MIRENDLLPDGSRVLLGFSGGPDSTALFHALLTMREKRGISIGCAHLNYRLRGRDSDLDEQLVRNYCCKYDIPIFVFRPKKSAKWSEESLREERYDFFESIRKTHGYDCVATAHTKDDQAETVLMRFLRGSGPDGLAGIPIRHKAIIRPLIGVSKPEILEFLAEEKLSFRNDRSNLDTNILRNRIRHELLPILERDYQKNIVDILVRNARVFSEYRKQEKNREQHIPLRKAAHGTLTFSRTSFLSLDARSKTELLRNCYRDISGELSPSEAFIREAKKCIESEKGKTRIFASKRLKIEVRGDTVSILQP